MEPVDFYCERVAAGFGGEPLNALTGLAFLVVGLWVWAREAAPDVRRAAAALALVGVASAAQHGVALAATVTADVLANALYLTLLGAVLLGRLAGARPVVAVIGAAAVVLLVDRLLRMPEARALLGLAADTFVLLVLVLILSALAARKHSGAAQGIALAALVLAAGLPFRFLDGALCTAWPSGTHWIWHLFNATASALLLTALARHPAGPRGAGGVAR